MIRVRFNLGSIFNFIYLNIVSKHIKGDIKKGYIIIPYPHCVFEFDKNSVIELNAPFHIGVPSIRKSRKVSYLFMGEDAKMIVNHESLIYDGYDLQIHRNGLCEMNYFHSNTGLEISCGNHIVFEGEVTCGRHVAIKDFNGHYVSYEKYPLSSPVNIKNHTWLCTGCTIGPGVTIGEGVVISDNSNVIDNMPSNTFCAGNPAVVIERNIKFKI